MKAVDIFINNQRSRLENQQCVPSLASGDLGGSGGGGGGGGGGG